MDSTNPYQSPESGAPLDRHGSPQPPTRKASVLRYVGVMFVLVLGLYLVGIAAVRAGALIAPLLPRIELLRIGEARRLIATLLLHLIGDIAIGYLLAKFLRWFNPWYVWIGLLVVFGVVFVFIALPFDFDLAVNDRPSRQAKVLGLTLFVLILGFLSLALGIWCGRRTTASIPSEGDGHEDDQPRV